MSSKIEKSWSGTYQFVAVAFVCLLTCSTAQAVPVLVEHFKFDETGSTTTAANSANPGNPGTLGGTFIDGDSHWTPVSVNNGLRFDGTTDFVGLATARTFTSTDAWSVSFWTNNTTTALDNMIMGTKDVGSNFIWYYPNNYFRFYNSSSKAFDFTAVKTFTGLNHFILTADGDEASLYHNGIFLQTVTGGANTTEFKIDAFGDAYTTYELDGDLDDVGIWTGELAAEQITAIYEFATESVLNYDLGQVQQLFEAFANSSPTVDIDGTIWRLIDDGSLGGALGTPIDIGGGDFEVNLGAGNGFTTFAPTPAPEPSSLLLLGLGALGLVRQARRRRSGRA